MLGVSGKHFTTTRASPAEYTVRVLETVHTALAWTYLYRLTVSGYNRPEVLDTMPWPFGLSLVVSAMIGASVQVSENPTSHDPGLIQLVAVRPSLPIAFKASVVIYGSRCQLIATRLCEWESQSQWRSYQFISTASLRSTSTSTSST
jgi:hypothetical protein